MLPQESWMDIKVLKAQGYSQRAVARMMGVHRDTVRRVWDEGEPRKYRRDARSSKRDGFKEQLPQIRLQSLLSPPQSPEAATPRRSSMN